MTSAGRGHGTPGAPAGGAAAHAPAAPPGPPTGAWPPPGREADALVAQRVFGWTVQLANGQPYQISVRRHDGTVWTHRQLVPAFSTEVRAALQVVERLADPASRRGVELVRDAHGCWHARFVRWGRASPRFVAAATLPQAICQAALAAVDFLAARGAAAAAAGEPEIVTRETRNA